MGTNNAALGTPPGPLSATVNGLRGGSGMESVERIAGAGVDEELGAGDFEDLRQDLAQALNDGLRGCRAEDLFAEVVSLAEALALFSDPPLAAPHKKGNQQDDPQCRAEG